MFNKFFQGSVDDLLNHVAAAPTETINKVGNVDEVLNRDEAIATVMDDMKVSKADAEAIVTELQLEEFDRIAKDMVEKGLLEITSYDNEGNPQYTPTQKGLNLLK